MSYSLGQAKWVPGQIHFQTTPTGRLPSVQPLIEAGLPIAPYIEHGSYATGQPAIMRYGRDPYRGLGQTPEEIVRRTIEATVPPLVMVGTGVVAGAAGGLAGGLLGKTVLGTVLGAVGGGILGWMGWQSLTPSPAPPVTPPPEAA